MLEIEKKILEACLSINEQSDSDLKLLLENFGAELGRFESNLKVNFSELETGEIEKLIKIFTRLDLITKYEFGSGSTSQIYILLEELEKRGSQLADELRIWAFHTTNNPYVPFGTRNQARSTAKSVSEYYRLQHERQAEVTNHEHQQKEQAKKNVEGRANRHKQRLEEHKNENEERRVLINGVIQLKDSIQRLIAILKDDKHPPYYYPEKFAEIDKNSLSGLPVEISEKLVQRLSRAPKGKWRDLRGMLIAVSCEATSRP